MRALVSQLVARQAGEPASLEDLLRGTPEVEEEREEEGKAAPQPL